MSDNLELLSSLAESGWADSMTMGTDETADGSPTAVASDVLRWAVAEIARLRLTDAEREAVSRVYDLLCDRSRELQSATRLDEARPLIQWATTLQGLWERTGGGE